MNGRGLNPERREREWRRAYESEERVRWIQDQPCCNCGAKPSENAHIETGGMGRKADADKVVPLCERCHHDLHSHGRSTFEAGNGISLERAAKRTQEQWEARGWG